MWYITLINGINTSIPPHKGYRGKEDHYFTYLTVRHEGGDVIQELGGLSGLSTGVFSYDSLCWW